MVTAIQDWSDIATRDIKQVYEILNEAHPAKLDASNREFNDWLDSGYQQALLLAGRSQSQSQAEAALNFYTTGFMDNHLGAAGARRNQAGQIGPAGSWSITTGGYFAQQGGTVCGPAGAFGQYAEQPGKKADRRAKLSPPLGAVATQELPFSESQGRPAANRLAVAKAA
ncbi:hypothetical protein FQR65_LT07996 [Abscondita terminalis]|nr:hypothetical protein FQR65_LT07996 [Abscondita terminalis]